MAGPDSIISADLAASVANRVFAHFSHYASYPDASQQTRASTNATPGPEPAYPLPVAKLLAHPPKHTYAPTRIEGPVREPCFRRGPDGALGARLAMALPPGSPNERFASSVLADICVER